MIVPALMIYLQVMKWGNLEEILVPKIGLADGLIQHLYAESSASQFLQVYIKIYLCVANNGLMV